MSSLNSSCAKRVMQLPPCVEMMHATERGRYSETCHQKFKDAKLDTDICSHVCFLNAATIHIALSFSLAIKILKMNGLVDYGSSSEDEDEDGLQPFPGTTKHSSPANTRDGSRPAINGKPADVEDTSKEPFTTISADVTSAPMLGPARPAEFASIDNYEEDRIQELPPMPERDLLRYLTQPKIPMTSLPLAPSQTPDPAVTAKFKRFLELKLRGVHFNEDLANKASFKNPSLFATLLERAELRSQAQYSTTLPSHVFSHSMFPEWAFKEGLLKSQQAISAELEAAKKSKSSSGKRTIEFAPASRVEAVSQESSPSNPSKRKRT